MDLRHCPTARKPRPNADPEDLEKWKALRKEQRLTCVAAQRLVQLRNDLDSDPSGKSRTLAVSVDGGFTNTTVFRSIPANTILIGRIRKDAKLYAPPPPPQPAGARGAGRRKVYGELLPTPEAVRKDQTIGWNTVQAWGAGKVHDFQIKTVPLVRWRGAGKQDMRLVVIAPLGYRLTKTSPVLYRDPAYLICTDPNLALEKLLQYYLWRWGIEVNFRDLKTTLGMGEAQVWTPKSVALVPAFIAAAYAYLQLACHATYGARGQCPLPNPKWIKDQAPQERITTAQMVKLLRGDLWGRALGVFNISDFATTTRHDMKSEKFETHLKSAVIYAMR